MIVFNFIFSLAFIIVFFPVFLLIGLLLKFQLKNISIFYVQKRVGYNGVVFNLYKFRTMIANADDELQRILNENEDARNEYAEYKKLKNDPRIIKGIGVFLRRSG